MTKTYGLLIDLDLRTRCRTCAVACKMEHSLEHISGIRVETIGGSGRDAPAGKYPKFTMYCRYLVCTAVSPLVYLRARLKR